MKSDKIVPYVIKFFFTTKFKSCPLERIYGTNFITYGMNFITLEILKNVPILGYIGIKNVISEISFGREHLCHKT